MYRGYDDDHEADTLSDFGLELPVDETAGILVSPDAVDHILLNLERDDEFPVEHVVLRPVGVGPSQAGMFSDVEGCETVFVNIHPVRRYDIPGHYVRAETRTTTASMERSTFDQHAQQNTIVKPRTEHDPVHWQDPENDPSGVLDENTDN
jgi:hypothetical protein